ncbi:MAG TPA: SpoIIE family protein phosphatase [Bryobacteraceae bacterium]
MYVRLNSVSIFVRDQDRSLQFYVDRLGFSPAFDVRLPSGERWLTVAPPDGTAALTLVAPEPGSDEYSLIGRPTQVVLLTEDVFAKFKEWRTRGVCFHNPPEMQCWGAVTASFEDPDGNSFTLLSHDELTRELNEQRRAHVEKRHAEHRGALDLEAARQVQARLFPQTQPKLASLDLCGHCSQARHVGGDYYDFLGLGRERLGLVVGDVSGKGTAAALLMANLQAHLRNLCGTYWNRPYTPFALEQPQRFLVAANRLFRENLSDNAYATLFFGEYNDQTQQLRFANCGHPAAILFRSNGEVERLDSTCGVVGLFKDWDCVVGERCLSPGDTLAIYTDGVTESFNSSGEEFGEERLVEALHRHRHLPVQNVLASLLDDIRRFSPHEQHDDITLVIARCMGNGTAGPSGSHARG